MFEQFAFYFPAKDVDKQIHLYLPDNYEESKEHFPVVYMYDGHNLFFDEDATYGTSWGLLDFMDTYDKQVIIVGIECSHEEGERIREYCPYPVDTQYFGHVAGYGDVYMDWLVNELKPFIDDNYPTLPDREATAIAGSSMGGLMAFYSVIAHNDVFSKAGALSPAFGFAVPELEAEIAQHDIDPDTRVFFSYGDEEVNFERLKPTATFNDAIIEAGGETHVHIEEGGDHSEATWRKQNRLYMDFLWK